MSSTIANFSFWFALLLSIGSLFFYLSGAIWNRRLTTHATESTIDFNLGLPNIGTREELFAIALVAAGTSLSTVFVFFLTAGGLFGWWLFLSPPMFAAGNWVMFEVFRRTIKNGYFDETSMSAKGAAGLLPYLGQALTGSQNVGWLLTGLSLFNLLAVLVLELIVGVEVLGYLARNTFRSPASSLTEFVIFVVSVLLLLGYVFIGGFRAVITSDVWQMKAMKYAIVITLISILVYGFSSLTTLPDLRLIGTTVPNLVLWGFVLNVILANLFVPMSQESSWQRFRAFSSDGEFRLNKALKLSITKSVGLWFGLIFLAFGLLLVIGPSHRASLTSLSNVLDIIRTLNDWWFPLCVFPVLTVAALSAMYSTADTCVSSLLYLIEYSRVTQGTRPKAARTRNLPSSYYLAMALIFAVSIAAYGFVRIWFNPTILQLVFSVFSNLVVVAPTIISTTLMRPDAMNSGGRTRTPYVMTSLIFGSMLYWTTSLAAIVKGQDYLWLSQLSIVLGLIGALLPLVPLWLGRKSNASLEIRTVLEDRTEA
jgi:hypothetical protein